MRNATHADVQCRQGHTGPLCAVCLANHARDVTMQCTPCPPVESGSLRGTSTLAMTFGVIAAMACGASFYSVASQRDKKKKKKKNKLPGSIKAPPPSTVVAPVAEPEKEDEKPEDVEDQEDTPGSAIAGAASDELQARAAARAGEVDAEGGVATTSAGFSNVSVNRDLFEIAYARAKILLSFMQIFSGFSMALEINWPPALKNLMKSFTFVNIES